MIDILLQETKLTGVNKISKTSKLDVFLWFTVKCYECWSFCKKILTNLRKCRTNQSTKEIHLRGKKGKHETGKRTKMPVTVTA